MSDLQDAMTRRGLLGRAIGAAAVASALSSQSNAQTTTPARIRQKFDFDWKFSRGDFPEAVQPNFADASWRTLDVPHDWSVEGPFAQDEPSSGPGGNAPTGIGWYRKHFRVPASFQGRKVSVEFDGVYQNSEVWINGHYLGKRPFGYISFGYDITPHLNLSGENVIAVKVDNSRQPGSRWYSGSGIYRHTWLVAVNPMHVAQWGTFVTTPRVTAESANVDVRTRVRNAGAAPATCSLTTAVVDRDGRVVQSNEASQSISANDEYEFDQQLAVANPNRWGVNNPYMYKLTSTVRVNGQVADVYETPFGIRSALFDADKGFLLNGERVKMNGVCLHHDASCLGAAVPERVWERRFEILREMGCNAIRTSHNPMAPEFLDLCDKMGFLVMDELYDEWKAGKPQVQGNGYSLNYDEWHERDTVDFIRRDRNHPSVALWSCGNEIGDQKSENGVEILRDLINIFHREDPTRMVTAGCDQIAAEPTAAPVEFLNLLDIVGYNYVDRWRERKELYYSVDKLAHPNWRMIGTESSGMGGTRGAYSPFPPPPTQAAAIAAPGRAPARGGFGGMFGGRGVRGLDTELLWKFVGAHDYVAGDFMWTGIDYLGESRWPSRGAGSGCIDSCGFPKDGYYFYQSMWTKKPMLRLSPHWNWKGHEGEFLTLTAYTNCDNVELFLNGKSVGVKGYAYPRFGMQGRYGQTGPQAMNGPRTTTDLHLTWDVPYQPGTIRAVGKKQGEPDLVVELKTTGDAAAIDLTLDQNTIQADRQDVAHVIVKVTDAQGNMHPDADQEVTFELQGPGKLIGVDNGNMADLTDFKGNKRKAFHGMCLAIVQSTGTPGQIKVTATAPGLKSNSVTITSKA